MTPKEQAIRLYNRFLPYIDARFEILSAKQCALIAVDEILDNNLWFKDEVNNNYWEQVKQEIEKL